VSGTAQGPRPKRGRAAWTGGQPEWADWPDERLLDMRLCDLGVSVRGSEVADRVRQLYEELKSRGLVFRPHVWLSDEWHSPDGVPGVAIPFYLAHPRLARLEMDQLLEVEGGTAESCMRLLRHETGHAIENAFRLRRRRQRQRLFGKTSERYHDYYVPRPYSRRFVSHLEMWYAQSHPDEDFAETFAVWLVPDSNWRERYAGWPALRKLEYMDELMTELAGTSPPVTNRERVDPIWSMRKTLRQLYHEKREHYRLDEEVSYDRDLHRLFSSAPAFAQNTTAARFLARIRREARRKVARWTGAYQYTIDQVLGDIIDRCRELRLRLAVPEEQARLDFTIALTVRTMNHLHSGGHRIIR
jgi:Putative zinc-binding metallo-peptidase